MFYDGAVKSETAYVGTFAGGGRRVEPFEGLSLVFPRIACVQIGHVVECRPDIIPLRVVERKGDSHIGVGPLPRILQRARDRHIISKPFGVFAVHLGVKNAFEFAARIYEGKGVCASAERKAQPEGDRNDG